MTVELRFGEILHAGEGLSEITRDAWNRIRNYVMEEVKLDLNDHPYRYKIGLSWVVTEGPYTGAITRRIANALFKEHKVKLTQEQISTIGNLAAAGVKKSGTIHYDVVQPPYSWGRGDFGQSGGSCFWSIRPQALRMLNDNPSMAMRFFEETPGTPAVPDGNNVYPGYTGMGRIWIAYYEKRYEHPSWLMFNAYGVDLDLAVRLWLPHAGEGFTTKSVPSYNSEGRADDSDFYVNGNVAVLVGHPDDINRVGTFYIQWKVPKLMKCSICGKHVATEKEIVEVDGEDLCGECVKQSTAIAKNDGLRHKLNKMVRVSAELWTADYITENIQSITVCVATGQMTWLRETVMTEEGPVLKVVYEKKEKEGKSGTCRGCGKVFLDLKGHGKDCGNKEDSGGKPED